MRGCVWLPPTRPNQLTFLQKKVLLAKRSSKPKLPTSKPSARRVSSPPEDKLFGTPGEASRTLKFTSNLLLDEEADFNGLNDASFTMPTPRKAGAPADSGVMNFTTSDPTPVAEETPIAPSPEKEKEETPARSSPPPEPGRRAKRPEPEPDTPQRPPPTELAEPARQTPKAGGVKLGAEVERISSKIASVYGDMLHHAHDGKRPSSTKDIM
jgi:hypothetical protein